MIGILIHLVRKTTPRFTKSPSLVLIRLVLTEIQPLIFKNIKINKEMYGHPDIQTASRWPYISLQSFTYSNGCILLTIVSIYTIIGDFVKLGLHFMTMWINSCYNLGQNKMEQLSPFPSPQSNDEGAKQQKRAILASLKWGEGWSRWPFILSKIAILDRIKWNNYPPSPPPPPKAMMKEWKSKNAPFWHHWNGGGSGPDVPFILSKIVVP